MPNKPITKQMIDDLAKAVTKHPVTKWRMKSDSTTVTIINAIGQKFTLSLPEDPDTPPISAAPDTVLSSPGDIDAHKTPPISAAHDTILSAGAARPSDKTCTQTTQIGADHDTVLSPGAVRPNDKTRTPPPRKGKGKSPNPQIPATDPPPSQTPKD